MHRECALAIPGKVARKRVRRSEFRGRRTRVAGSWIAHDPKRPISSPAIREAVAFDDRADVGHSSIDWLKQSNRTFRIHHEDDGDLAAVTSVECGKRPAPIFVQ